MNTYKAKAIMAGACLCLADAQAGPAWEVEAVYSGEVNLELSYLMPITDWLTVQPDVQYIIDPGALGELNNALVLGLRFELARAF